MRNWKTSAAVFSLVLIFWACAPRTVSSWTTWEDLEIWQGNAAVIQPAPGFLARCNDEEGHVPDTAHLQATPVRYLRTVMHIMNSSDSMHDYYSQKGERYARDLLQTINDGFSRNVQMRLPPGNRTPVLPIRVRLQWDSSALDGRSIFFHFDDDLCYFIKSGRFRNNTSRAVISKYGYHLDSVLNIFLLPHHPDSAASNTYRADYSGITLGNAIKIAGMFEADGAAHQARGLLIHEIGHVLGLSHSWLRDGCDDTPEHENCWTRGEPPCDGITSNNVMDYNDQQAAWTPCQIGKIHRNLANTRSRVRQITVPHWCDLDTTQNTVITDSVIWKGARDLPGHLVLQPGAFLGVRCRLSMPQGGMIVVHPGAALLLDGCHLHNSCGLEWNGIRVLKRGKEVGKVYKRSDPIIENSMPLAQNF